MAGTAAEEDRPTRPGALAGALAPPVFLGGLLVLDVLAGRVEVSDHELGPRGWAMHLVFALTGLLALALAVALRRQLRARRSGRVAAAFVALWGLGALLGTATPDPGDAQTWHGSLHLAGFLLVTLALLPAMVAFGTAVRRDPRWRGWAVGSWVAAAVTAGVVLAPVPSGPGYPVWTGPASMLELVLLCAWLEAVSVRLLRLSRDARTRQDAEPAATAATS